MSPLIVEPQPAQKTKPNEYSLALAKRMRGPQRHRLLQGYPMPGVMVPYDRERGYEPVTADTNRPLIVGILPHASCNPSVKGCGYCTFPHEAFRRSEVEATVDSVCREVEASKQAGRSIEALYFGGGTANLTPAASFRKLCRSVAKTFDTRQAEVTLEGAPLYFTSQREALLEILESELPGQNRRLSMGVQTFDRAIISEMGRSHLGAPEMVHAAVEAARRRGMTTSADLMINMPGQTLEDMKSDLQQASDLGFSQVCIYHLVLFRGLGTPWAKERDKLAALPDNDRAFANWQEVTALARELGYRQTSLTNFEREGHYRYEECSYRPALFDGIGFGPEALSCHTNLDLGLAVKWMNEASSKDYREAVSSHGHGRSRLFVYGQTDLRLLYLTRSLARREACRETYRRSYGSDLVDDFRPAWEALKSAGLVGWNERLLKLTERGTFFADSVAGLLAAERVSELRNGIRPDLNDAPVFRMG